MKPRMSLLPWKAIVEVARLMSWALEKGVHERDTWKHLGHEEHTDAMLRHLTAELTDTEVDESGFRHDVHVAFRALARVAVRLRR